MNNKQLLLILISYISLHGMEPEELKERATILSPNVYSPSYLPETLVDNEIHADERRLKSYPTNPAQFILFANEYFRDSLTWKMLKEKGELFCWVTFLKGLELQHKVLELMCKFMIGLRSLDLMKENEKIFKENILVYLSSDDAFNFFITHTSLFANANKMQTFEKKWIEGFAKILLDQHWKNDPDINALILYAISLYDEKYLVISLPQLAVAWTTILFNNNSFFAGLEKEKPKSFLRKNLTFLLDGYKITLKIREKGSTEKRASGLSFQMRELYQQITRPAYMYLQLQDYYVHMYNISIEHANRLQKKYYSEAEFEKNKFEPLKPFAVSDIELPGLKVFDEFRAKLPPQKELVKEEKEKAIKKKKQKKELAREKCQMNPAEPIRPQTKIAAAPDGSFLLCEEGNLYIIEDPKNAMTICLFKTDLSQPVTTKLPLDYSPNVKEWFDSPEAALKNQGYLDPVNKQRYASTKEKQKEMIAFHQFAQKVDDFIASLGLQTTTPSRRDPNQEDILITIPGSVEFENVREPEELRGIFTYIINAKTGVCYHRMFELHDGARLLNDLIQHGVFVPDKKGFYDVWFPPLEKK